jgi:hypothetical protein
MNFDASACDHCTDWCLYLSRISLSLHVKKKSRLSPEAATKLENRRQKLFSRIEAFQKSATIYLSYADDDICASAQPSHRENDLDDLDAEEWEDDTLDTAMTAETRLSTNDSIHPENMVLSFPSLLGVDMSPDPGFQALCKQELELRKGQASDALHQIRLALGYKEFLYRTNVRSAKSQQKKSRAWAELITAEGSLKQQVKIYNRARHAMTRLGATEDTLCMYQVLSKRDLQVDTSVQDPRMRNLHRSKLSWIWHVNAQEDMSSINWMSECKSYS